MMCDGVFIFDGLSKFVGSFVLFFTAIIFIYSLRSIRSNSFEYYLWFFLTALASLGVVFTRNIWLIIILWGFLGLALFQLINIKPSTSAAAIAKKTFIIVGGSDGLMLLGFVIYNYLTGSSVIDGYPLHIKGGYALAAFILIAAGAFAKAGCMPLHTWVPDVAEGAEISVVAYLPASLDKLLGIYLLARIVKDTFVLNTTAQIILILLGAGTIVFAVMMALIQHNVRRLLGYHAVSQVGYMVLGIGCATPLGIAAGLLHMLNNALYKSCLFLGVGNVEERTGTAEMEKLGGLGRFMPFTFFAVLIAAFAISGIPPLNGFVSKWMVYQGLVDLFNQATLPSVKIVVSLSLVMALIGSGLTLASFLKILSGVFLGKTKKRVKEVSPLMYIPPLVLASLCIIFGIFFYSTAFKFITASVGSFSLTGLWRPVFATNLILLGILGGYIFYKIFAPRTRVSSTYLGGEEIVDEVKSEDFYVGIRKLPLLGSIYTGAQKKFFDVYEQGRNLIFSFTHFLRYLHNGVLPTYLVWCLIGMMGLIYIFLR